MPKRKVDPSEKRLIISARVTPAERDALLHVGDGNISRGLDRIMMALASVLHLRRSSDGASPPPACG